jgi:predicted patatin/cPLA2 family phospholipase
LKTGLIIEGGGMKCAYSAAILDAFLKDGIDFDCCIGVSAGAGNAVSYLAGQYGRNLRYYTIHLSDPYYFGLRSFLHCGSFYGLRHIYGDMTNEGGADPLDYDSMMANPTDLLIAATRADSGRTVYFHKEQMKRNDYRMLMASCAIPAVCKPIRIGRHEYYDGGVSNSIPIDKALAEGCDRVVVLLTKYQGFRMQPQKHRFLYSRILREYPAVVHELDTRHIVFNRTLDRLQRLEEEGTVMVLRPSEALKSGTYDMNPAENQKLYDLGMKDYDEKRTELFEFLQKKN